VRLFSSLFIATWSLLYFFIKRINSFQSLPNLVAANASYSPGDMSGLSNTSLNQLMEAETQTVVSTTVAFVNFSEFDLMY
jgi:hypothetical protein